MKKKNSKEAADFPGRFGALTWRPGDLMKTWRLPVKPGELTGNAHGGQFTLLRYVRLKKQKTCTVFLSSYRNTSESLGKRGMLCGYEPQASVSTAFSSSPKLSLVFV